MSKHFRIRGEKSSLFFHVYIYDNLREMRKAVVRYSKRTFQESDPLTKSLYGVHHPYTKVKLDKEELLSNDIGIIRLAKTQATTYIVSHEVMHAALWQFRVQNKKKEANFWQACGTNEEKFADLYSTLFCSMNRKLYKHGVWK